MILHPKYMLSVSSVALCVAAAPAFAQTAIDNIFDLMTSEGGTVAFDARNEAGGTVEWTGLRMAAPDDEMVITTDWLKIETDGNQSVLTMAPVAEIAISDRYDGPMATIQVTTEGLEYTIVQNGDEITHTYTAASVLATRLSGEILKSMNVNLSTVSGNHTEDFNDKYILNGVFSIGNMAVEYNATDDDFVMAADQVSEGFSVSYGFDAPGGDLREIESLSEIQFNMEMEAGASKGTNKMGEGREIMDISATTGPSSMSASMELGRASYDMSATDVAYNIQAMGMGLPPMDIAASELTMGMSGPVAMTDGMQDMRLLVAFRELAVSEGLWSMIDPQQTIPRDPANLIIDIDGAMRWLVEPVQGPGPGEMPVELDSLTINELTLQVGGAEVLASGAATFDNGGPMPFPMPIGEVDVAINGVFGLVDALGGLGLVPPEAAMMARGMVGALANPTGPDNFESKIEFKQGGQITANGQPLPF